MGLNCFYEFFLINTYQKSMIFRFLFSLILSKLPIYNPLNFIKILETNTSHFATYTRDELLSKNVILNIRNVEKC